MRADVEQLVVLLYCIYVFQIKFFCASSVKLILQAQDFRQQGTKIRRKMWFQNMKIKLIVLGIIIALILIIVLSVCGGFNCGK